MGWLWYEKWKVSQHCTYIWEANRRRWLLKCGCKRGKKEEKTDKTGRSKKDLSYLCAGLLRS